MNLSECINIYVSLNRIPSHISMADVTGDKSMNKIDQLYDMAVASLIDEAIFARMKYIEALKSDNSYKISVTRQEMEYHIDRACTFVERVHKAWKDMNDQEKQIT